MDHCLYLKDNGIYKKNNYFYYHKTNKIVNDNKILEHLNKIRVPPAWENVWYSSNKNCHIQVTGIDQSGKKQYIFSNEWTLNSKYLKYTRMKLFINDLNSFKKKIKLTLPHGNLDHHNLICLLFNLLIDTHIRVGNEKYASQNNTYGLTTLRQKHLIKKNDIYYFSFIGKSAIQWNVKVPLEYIPFINKLKLNNKNKPLFWYLSSGEIKEISSEELNVFLKENMGKDYTCKDFRTYSANILFIKSFLKESKKNKINEINEKKIILKCISDSAENLGHSKGISKKSYISNNLLDYCINSFSKASTESIIDLLSRI
jgi:DNA topoisomerase-1